IGSDEDSHTAIVGRLCQLRKLSEFTEMPYNRHSQQSRRISSRYRTLTSRGSSTSFGMRDCYYAFSFRSRISPTSCGLAFPLDSLITCPLRKFSDAAFPALKSAI